MIAETSFHVEAFGHGGRDPPHGDDKRVIIGAVDHEFEDVDAFPEPEQIAVLASDANAAGCALGFRAAYALGAIYPSVRRPGG